MKQSKLMIFVWVLTVALLPGWGLAQGKGQQQAGRLARLMMQCQERFDGMDTNKDGMVAKGEFMAQHHPGRRADDIFKSRDSNGDGVLTQEEFCSGKGMGRGMGKGKNQ